MTTDQDRIIDILESHLRDAVADIEKLIMQTKNERIIELETELRITQAALARATAGVPL